MNSGKTLTARLRQKLADRENGGTFLFKERINDFAFSLTIKDFDSLAVAMEAVEISNAAFGRQLTLEELHVRAQSLQNKMRKVVGELDVLEVDNMSLRAQLRSTMEGGETSSSAYYEVVLSGAGLLTVHRYAYDPAAKARKCVPFSMTIDTFETFVNDVVHVLEAPVNSNSQMSQSF